MKTTAEHTELVEAIVGRLLRRHSTAVVLFHHAMAERLALGPTDLKCLDLLREGAATSGSELARRTGLTSGAITGAVTRLERAGYLRREPDPADGRKHRLRVVPIRVADLTDAFEPIRADVTALLESFGGRELAGIVEFLERTTETLHRHLPLLRAGADRPAGVSSGAPRPGSP